MSVSTAGCHTLENAWHGHLQNPNQQASLQLRKLTRSESTVNKSQVWMLASYCGGGLGILFLVWQLIIATRLNNEQASVVPGSQTEAPGIPHLAIPAATPLPPGTQPFEPMVLPGAPSQDTITQDMPGVQALVDVKGGNILNVRSKPGMGEASLYVIGSLPDQSVVTLSGRAVDADGNTWARIGAPGTPEGGWVFAPMLIPLSEDALTSLPVVDVEFTQPPMQPANSGGVSAPSAGQQDPTAGKVYIGSGNMQFVVIGYYTPAPGEICERAFIVTAQTTNVYEAQDTSSAVLGTVRRNDPLPILDTQAGWYRVSMATAANVGTVNTTGDIWVEAHAGSLGYWCLRKPG